MDPDPDADRTPFLSDFPVCADPGGRRGESPVLRGRKLVLSSPADVCILGAVSYISFEKAAESMEKETAGKDFMRIAAEAKAIWDAQLSKARVEGNTEERKPFIIPPCSALSCV